MVQFNWLIEGKGGASGGFPSPFLLSFHLFMPYWPLIDAEIRYFSIIKQDFRRQCRKNNFSKSYLKYFYFVFFSAVMINICHIVMKDPQEVRRDRNEKI